ncbi:MAG TPA: HEAT repeat domain-containing protein [Gemmataceae bacterium]|nr:HEAT repeat domain-containing protein [Gemmataceae bacterium]
MRYKRFLLAFLLPVLLTLPARAGVLFGKHAKPNPAERVPQLVLTLKTDKDEDKRSSAAKELRDYDPASFPEIVPVLTDALQHDQKPSVRAEAAQSLGRIRPISQQVGWVLEEATRDAAIRVRLQARTSLMNYRLAGYHPAKPPEPVAATPAAQGVPPIVQTRRASTYPPANVAVIGPNETMPPPLAQPVSGVAGTQPPTGMPQPYVFPATPPKLQKPPTPTPDQGPDLPPG